MHKVKNEKDKFSISEFSNKNGSSIQIFYMKFSYLLHIGQLPLAFISG